MILHPFPMVAVVPIVRGGCGRRDRAVRKSCGRGESQVTRNRGGTRRPKLEPLRTGSRLVQGDALQPSDTSSIYDSTSSTATMSTTESTTPGNGAEKPRSTAETDITKYKVGYVFVAHNSLR